MSRQVAPIACTWQEIPLTVTRITDQVGRAWVTHQYPGRDGAQMEDQGAEPLRLQIEAVLYGADWLVQLQRLRSEVEDLADTEGRFVHPYWGGFYGFMTSLQVLHEDRRLDFCTVTLAFQEGRLIPEDVQAVTVTLQVASERARSVLTQAAEALAALEGA